MSLTANEKQLIVAKFQRDAKDTGSPEVQIALLTNAITKLTGHMQENKKDFHSRYGLLKKVNQRRKLLSYLKNRDAERYNVVIKELGLRK